MSKAGELALRHIKKLTLDDLPPVSGALVDIAVILREELRAILEPGQQVIVRNGNHEVIGKLLSVSRINARVKIGREARNVDILALRPIEVPVPYAAHAHSG